MTTDWVAPAACTLPTDERPLRVAAFDDLFTHHVVGAERLSPTRLSLTLQGDSDLPSVVRDLTAREAECCSFFDFEIDRQPDVHGVGVALRLNIDVPAERTDVLTALASRVGARGRAGRLD